MLGIKYCSYCEVLGSDPVMAGSLVHCGQVTKEREKILKIVKSLGSLNINLKEFLENNGVEKLKLSIWTS